MRVVEPSDTQPLEAGVIYLIPPQSSGRVVGDTLVLDPRARSGSGPIDILFSSMAGTSNAGCGILISADATDGVEGLRELRESGGITFVHKPEAAGAGEGSRGVAEARTADFIGSIEEIAAELIRRSHHPYLIETVSGTGESVHASPPELDSLQIGDVLHVSTIQSLMDDFYQLARVPMSIIDLQGNVLVGVGWQDVCMRFHRVHPETSRHCRESDTELAAQVPPGESRLYRCKNGMWDMVTPVFVGGEHVGNVFSGQFFFDDEPVDYEFFRKQARRYGFDEAEYLAAIEAVPKLSRATVETGMAFFKKLAGFLSRLSFANIKLAHALSERDALTDSLKHSHEDLNRAQKVASTGSWRLNTRKNELLWSDEAHRIFGIPLGVPLTYETFLSTCHPDDREYVDSKWKAALEGEPYDIEHRVVRADGVRWVREQAVLEFDQEGGLLGGFGTSQDITQEKQAQAELARAYEAEVEARRQASEELELSETLRRATEALTSSIDLQAVLETLARLIVKSTEASRVIALLAEPGDSTLRVAVVEGYPMGEIDREWQLADLGVVHQETVERRESITVDYESEATPRPVRERAARVGARLALWTPIVWKSEFLGMIGVDEQNARHEFSAREIDLIGAICGQAAAAIVNARLYETEHKIADRLQEALLSLPSKIHGVEYAASYRSATAGTRVGGDFFDLFPLGEGQVGVTIGDVSGKGLPAAAFTSVARNVIRAHAVEGDPPEVVIAKTNAMVHRFTEPDVFLTAFFGILNTQTGDLSYCSGGHPEGIVVREGRKMETLTAGNPIIGAYGELEFVGGRTVLGSDDSLILYTDGVTEARGDAGLYGEKRLFRTIGDSQDQSAGNLVATIIGDVLSFCDGHLRDDTAIVVLRREPADKA